MRTRVMLAKFDPAITQTLRACTAGLLALVLAACATVSDPRGAAGAPAPGAVLRATAMSRDLEQRILALDPSHVSADDVRKTLTLGPAPRIINLHGGIFPTRLIMESFGNFLVRMGYPSAEVRDPVTRELSHSPYQSSIDLAGEIAWYYEHEGMRPMMIGHSQGGMQAVKVLYELAGKFDDRIAVFNPYAEAPEDRTTIVDPLTGAVRTTTSLVLPYVSAVGAGGVAFLLPNQWSMATRLYDIPDSVEDFTGFAIGVDLVAWDGPRTRDLYSPLGTAHVRNVRLPAAYSHLYVVNTDHLGSEANARAWINAWTPAMTGQDPPAGVDQENIQWAADVWYSIKAHWVTEAQRFVRARQALLAR
ncbi:MAG: hypothetical protein ABI440_01155 [Casimicrobiaceae bacterium]